MAHCGCSNQLWRSCDGTISCERYCPQLLSGLQAKHGSSQAQHSRYLRIQKTVDDANKRSNSMMPSDVEVLSELDNLKDVDAYVRLGQSLASEYTEALQNFVRYSLLAE